MVWLLLPIFESEEWKGKVGLLHLPSAPLLPFLYTVLLVLGQSRARFRGNLNLDVILYQESILRMW